MKYNYVYILECSDKTYYTGWTTDIKRRLKTHNKGTGAKYTRSRTPVKLIYLKRCASKSNALKQEYIIKQLSRKQKEKLIKGER